MTDALPPSGDFLDILRAERRDLIARLRQTRFSTLKPGYSYSQVIPVATYSPWLDDERFIALYEAARERTLVDVYRCYELYLLASQLGKVEGDVVEVGVWRGGTGYILASVLRDRAIHLFDTFQGVPKADGKYDTLYSGGEHADTSLESVRGLFDGAGLRAAIHVGIFPDDTGDDLPERICLAHIDVDTYVSARQCFDAAWPRLSSGGVLLFDDYGFFGCEGVAQAVGEMREGLTDGLFVHNLNGHAIFIKK
ncbi:MAG TPA: TylF/MycF/NovP-related O-methyltransferase [Allosphingosinicella sp.]|nr:TylF/MycF/NovP-related O-methyltransferase [Allosphingosinicella sp.]